MYTCKYMELVLLSVAVSSRVLLQVDALNMERSNLQDAYYLLTYCSECLLVWRLLCEYQFELIADGLTTVSRSGEKGSLLQTE